MLACTALGADWPAYDGRIRDQGDGLFSAYMVPYSHDNHAVTLEQLPDGSLVAAWFGGADEEASGTAIVVSRLVNGSGVWTNTTIVAQALGLQVGLKIEAEAARVAAADGQDPDAEVLC